MIIGLVGYKGSGKSTLLIGAALNIEIIGFSDPINKMLIALGIPREVIRDKSRWDKPLNVLDGKSCRYATQTLGTEWGRKLISNDLWLRVGMFRALEHERPVVFESVRFPNELKLIQTVGGRLIYVDRPGLEPDLTHESEQHIAALSLQCDVTFRNVKPLPESTADFRHVLQRILKS